ncbi:MAG: transcriptional regulator [Pelagibacteraceae bacterium]|nr:transcriptional regulator [Pelagibacteraceae bacterium]|tara:strand:- start:35 stop:376 length:342 start_codon:yes stop_codon:yes gene_type:complete
MKLITAIIKPDRVEALRKALNKINIHGLTLTEAKGYGRQLGHTEMYRGAEYEVHFLPKCRAEILVEKSNLEQAISTITEAVKSGKIGDGKIFITDVSDVIRIRTGERGAEAIS